MPGIFTSNSLRRYNTPQIKEGWWRVATCMMRFTKAFTRLTEVSVFSARKRRLRYNACLDELISR
jgi:hypothetical protein